MSSNNLTVHIRLTKKCNADCSYCSSFENNPNSLMTLSDLKVCLDNLKQLILKYEIGGNREHVTIQYIGGEILTIPINYLEKFTSTTKEYFQSLFKTFNHGCQTNLIGSFDKIKKLEELFDGNLGTSYDHFTNQRTISGDAKKYKTIFLKNIKEYKLNYGKKAPGIIVLDQKMKPFILDQVSKLLVDKTTTTVRVAFDGGLEAEKLTINEIKNCYSDIFDLWIMKSETIIEPFYSLTKKRYLTKLNKSIDDISGCAFQNDCFQKSINIEPNGDIFICQDLAEIKSLKIGNLIENTYNEELIYSILQRKNNLNKECFTCDYFSECQGGCLKESYEQGKGIYGRSDLCLVWKMLFGKIDLEIEQNGLTKLGAWLNRLA